MAEKVTNSKISSSSTASQTQEMHAFHMNSESSTSSFTSKVLGSEFREVNAYVIIGRASYELRWFSLPPWVSIASRFGAFPVLCHFEYIDAK
jgi:hypothetical protein